VFRPWLSRRCRRVLQPHILVNITSRYCIDGVESILQSDVLILPPWRFGEALTSLVVLPRKDLYPRHALLAGSYDPVSVCLSVSVYVTGQCSNEEMDKSAWSLLSKPFLHCVIRTIT